MMTDAVSGLPPNLSKCYKTYLLSRTCPQFLSSRVLPAPEWLQLLVVIRSFMGRPICLVRPKRSI
jgi:hypothetical protein